MRSPFRIGTNGQDDSLTQRLRRHFEAARYGHFRTATLLNTATLSREWLYAVQDPHTRRCVLMKVREQETGLMERIRVKGEMPFIDALDQMGRFEDFSLNPQYIAAVTAEIDTLGETYFNAFANREGLVRDHQSGVFQPTLQGQVVTGGLFDPKELARVLKYTQNPPEKTEKFLVPNYTAIAVPDPAVIEHLMAMYDTVEKIKRATAFHAALRSISHYNLLSPRTFYEDEYCEDLKKIGRGYIKAARQEHNKLLALADKQKLRHKIGSYLSAPANQNGPFHDDRFSAFLFYKILSDLRVTSFGNPDFDRQHQQMLDQQELTFEISLAKHYTAIIFSDHEKHDQAARQLAGQRLKKRIEIMDKLAARMGIDDVMRSALHASVYGEILPTCFQATKDIVQSLTEAQMEMQTEIQSQKNNLKSLAPAP